MVIVSSLTKVKNMKKLIVLLAIGFAFTYCNPSQQADQTTADGSRAADTTATTSGTDTSTMPTDTTNRPDSIPH